MMIQCPYCENIEENRGICSACGEIIIKEFEQKNEEYGKRPCCPKCDNGMLVLKHNHKTGFPFYGCSNYPNCKYTQSIQPVKSCKNKKSEKTAAWQKNENDPYIRKKIGEIANSELRNQLSKGVSMQELSDLQDARYCKQKFDLNYPLLSKNRFDSRGYPRYYKESILINGEPFYLCNQWFETPANNDRPYLLRWLREHQDSQPKRPNATASSPNTNPCVMENKTTNPEAMQIDKDTKQQKVDLLFREVIAEIIKEGISHNVSKKFVHGYTPLMIAAKCNDEDMLTTIIAKLKETNGNLEERNDEGKTAYIVARESKAEKAMALLKEAGVRTDAPIIKSRKK